MNVRFGSGTDAHDRPKSAKSGPTIILVALYDAECRTQPRIYGFGEINVWQIE